jgi:hypothetical protein
MVGEGGNKVLQLEEETGEVWRGPKGVNGGGTMELTKGGEEAAAATAHNTARGGYGSATGADERSRDGEGRLWCASNGEMGREGKGVRRCLLNSAAEGRGRRGV